MRTGQFLLSFALAGVLVGGGYLFMREASPGQLAVCDDAEIVEMVRVAAANAKMVRNGRPADDTLTRRLSVAQVVETGQTAAAASRECRARLFKMAAGNDEANEFGLRWDVERTSARRNGAAQHLDVTRRNLPMCDDAAMLDQIVEGFLGRDSGASISLAGVAETSFDEAAQVRACRVLATKSQGGQTVFQDAVWTYSFKWLDRDRGQVAVDAVFK